MTCDKCLNSYFRSGKCICSIVNKVVEQDNECIFFILDDADSSNRSDIAW